MTRGFPLAESNFVDDKPMPDCRLNESRHSYNATTGFDRVTADASLFREAVAIGRRVLWLHTFGERMDDPAAGCSFGPPRVAVDPPSIPLAGRISGKPVDFPNTLDYDAEKRRLLVGKGYIENVSAKVWAYEISGKHILTHVYPKKYLKTQGLSRGRSNQIANFVLAQMRSTSPSAIRLPKNISASRPGNVQVAR
jgi:hypothetical protein